MNNYLSFHPPTQVDLRELFTLGLDTKRGATAKIGHKGSGLKFTRGVNGEPGESWRIAVTYQKAVVGKRIVKAGYAQQMNDEQEVWPCLWIHSFSFRCVLTRLCGATFSAVATIV